MRLEQKLGAFARETILTRPLLGTRTAFPFDIWQAMAREGLLDPGILDSPAVPPCLAMARGARAMAGQSGNLGLTLSWLMHHLTARYILGGSPDKSPNKSPGKELLGQMTTGEALVSFAVSEPGAGAHPKLMTARAEPRDGAWVLWGGKTYLTHGPVAQAFIVVAVTSEKNGKKSFSAFILDRDTPGLTVSPAMDVSVFRPVPHGSIEMNACEVADSAMVGPRGEAFAGLVLPFRQMEDAVMTGAAAGAIAFALNSLARGIADGNADCQASGNSQKVVAALGWLAAMVSAADLLSDQVAGLAGSGGSPEILVFFRQLTHDFLVRLDGLIKETGADLNEPGQTLVRDLAAVARIGGSVAGHHCQKLGQAVMARVRGK